MIFLCLLTFLENREKITFYSTFYGNVKCRATKTGCFMQIHSFYTKIFKNNYEKYTCRTTIND